MMHACFSFINQQVQSFLKLNQWKHFYKWMGGQAITFFNGHQSVLSICFTIGRLAFFSVTSITMGPTALYSYQRFFLFSFTWFLIMASKFPDNPEWSALCCSADWGLCKLWFFINGHWWKLTNVFSVVYFTTRKSKILVTVYCWEWKNTIEIIFVDLFIMHKLMTVYWDRGRVQCHARGDRWGSSTHRMRRQEQGMNIATLVKACLVTCTPSCSEGNPPRHYPRQVCPWLTCNLTFDWTANWNSLWVQAQALWCLLLVVCSLG